MLNVKIDIAFNNLPEITPALARETKGALKRTINEGVKLAQHNAPVDTGELRDEIHGEDEAGLAASVVSSVDHAIYQELGTSKMAAQPYMTPMSEVMRPKFIRYMQEAVERAAGG